MLPRTRRRFESFERANHILQTNTARRLRVLSNSMMFQQEAEKRGRVDRLNLPAQPVQRAAMNPAPTAAARTIRCRRSLA